MTRIQEAEAVLREALRRLNALIEGASSSHHYSDVVILAGYGDALAKLLGDNPVSPSASTPTQASTRESFRTGEDIKQVLQVAKPESYPRFVRDGNQIVKIGWSKKNSDEYQHRAPRRVFDLFIRQAQEKLSEGEPFTMETLLPLKEDSGETIPAYQAYLILAWLRSHHVIEKRGNEGYVAQLDLMAPKKVQEFWRQLPVIGSQ